MPAWIERLIIVVAASAFTLRPRGRRYLATQTRQSADQPA